MESASHLHEVLNNTASHGLASSYLDRIEEKVQEYMDLKDSFTSVGVVEMKQINDFAVEAMNSIREWTDFVKEDLARVEAEREAKAEEMAARHDAILDMEGE